MSANRLATSAAVLRVRRWIQRGLMPLGAELRQRGCNAKGAAELEMPQHDGVTLRFGKLRQRLGKPQGSIVPLQLLARRRLVRREPAFQL